jgi:hexosaminidase
MLDVSRDRVPTRATLERIVAIMARLRLNHLELYTEHTFAYPGHEVVWRKASPITADDVHWLDALCASHGIELSANQNCFGHMGRWLKHDAYLPLADAPDGWRTKRGMLMSPGVLSPTDQSLDFASGLLGELMPHFTSRRVNIGCDETFELGRGRSHERVEEVGRGRVYLDFLLRLLEVVHERGGEALFWGDVLRSHPELVEELPKQDTIALAWHYEAPLDADAIPASVLDGFSDFGFSANFLKGFEGQVPAFADAGIPFWVCPGTSSWNSLVGRLPNALANLLDASEVGLARGASGYLITDWGDNGHLQPPSVSFAPLAYGAGVSWCLSSNREIDLAGVLDEFVFDDRAGRLGAALVAMGDAYTKTGLVSANASPLSAALLPGTTLGTWGEATGARVGAVIDRLSEAEAGVAACAAACSDAEAVKAELQQALRLARHGAWRIAREVGASAPSDSELAVDLREAIESQRRCWGLRSRPGGLDDSIARLQKTLAEYES